MSGLPNLPGYRIDTQKKANFAKSHIFDVKNGVPTNQSRDEMARDARSVQPNLTSGGDTGTAAPAPSQEATMSRMPAWIAYDRKVLRFHAFFKERVYNSSIENFRVRKCVLYYYLEDDSVHIAEPKIENSGIPQGVFVKRHRIPKSNNQFINLNDLYIGAELGIYGRVFRLTDCDEFTGNFYRDNGVELGQPEQTPNDPFTDATSTEAQPPNKTMHPMKEFMEASLGKQMGQEIAATQQFLMNDGKVLRFYCLYDDNKLYGEKRPYVLHYFLADDTVEILEVKQNNSGRDPFPCMLKRQKLPVNYKDVAPTVASIGGRSNDKNVRYYHITDLRVGTFIKVFNRDLLICAADRFTKQFYMDNYGLTDEDFPMLNLEEAAPQARTIQPPPSTGFGSEEDSLGSFLYLMPKVPKCDFKKLMDFEGIKLRWLAKFVNPSPVDRERRFIVTFYVNNDTVSVFEKFQRNTGFIGGKFLERGRMMNKASEKYFSSRDFGVGKVVEINTFKFELIETDKFTDIWINEHPNYKGITEESSEQSF